MEKTALNIDIKKEQEKAQEQIKQQGLRVLVCAGTGCVANGSLKVIEKFKELGANVAVLSDYDKMTIVPTGCHGFCEQGVLVIIPDKHVTYVKVKVDDVEEIYESHIKNNQPVERLLYTDPKTREHVHKNEDINFYAKQTRTALANCGHINAECIDEAIAVRGYEALAKLKKLKNQDCAEEGAADSLPEENGDLLRQTEAENPTLFVTATRATPVLLWTEVLWKAIRTNFLKVWQLQHSQSGLTKDTSTSVRNIRLQLNVLEKQ